MVWTWPQEYFSPIYPVGTQVGPQLRDFISMKLVILSDRFSKEKRVKRSLRMEIHDGSNQLFSVHPAIHPARNHYNSPVLMFGFKIWSSAVEDDPPVCSCFLQSSSSRTCWPCSMSWSKMCMLFRGTGWRLVIELSDWSLIRPFPYRYDEVQESNHIEMLLLALYVHDPGDVS